MNENSKNEMNSESLNFSDSLKTNKKYKNGLIYGGIFIIAIIAIFFIMNSNHNDMIFVEGGTFEMGGGYDAKPIHTVTLSSYYIGKYEVTQEEYESLMGSNPANFIGAKKPVERVTWFEAVEFCNKMSEKEGLEKFYNVSGTTVTTNWGAKGYRLPTEAEWEYAARGGNNSRGYKYSGSNNLDEVGWYEDNTGGTTHEVGKKQPNELGIYDMSGNVLEWCNDWYGAEYYGNSPRNDPKGPGRSDFRILRGGSWYYGDLACLVWFRHRDFRHRNRADYGFRLSRTY